MTPLGLDRPHHGGSPLGVLGIGRWRWEPEADGVAVRGDTHDGMRVVLILTTRHADFTTRRGVDVRAVDNVVAGGEVERALLAVLDGLDAWAAIVRAAAARPNRCQAVSL